MFNKKVLHVVTPYPQGTNPDHKAGYPPWVFGRIAGFLVFSKHQQKLHHLQRLITRLPNARQRGT